LVALAIRLKPFRRRCVSALLATLEVDPVDRAMTDAARFVIHLLVPLFPGRLVRFGEVVSTIALDDLTGNEIP
jgi:hypothetical protein